MPLVLNEEQRILQETATTFLQQHSPVEILRTIRDDAVQCGYDKKVWQGMVEMGWPGMVVPEEYDGFNFGISGLGAVLMQCGRTLANSPLWVSSGICAPVLMLAGSEEQKKRLLPGIASGETTLGLAIDEGRVHNPAAVQLSASGSSSDWTLSGSKKFALDACESDYLLVSARSSGSGEQGISLFLVPSDAAGLKLQRFNTLDSRNACDIDFDNTPAELLGEADQGLQPLNVGLDMGRIVQASEMFGVAEEAFQRTTQYLKEREQFGAKIGTFQALKHRAARVYTELELTRSLILDAWEKADAALAEPTPENLEELALTASGVKARMSESGTLAVNEAVQMHGGIGMTDELEIGFFLKRMHMSCKLLGDAEFHHNRYAELSGI